MQARTAGTLLELVGGALRVPLVDGEWVRYANLDNAASAPALRQVADAVDELLALLRQRASRRGLRLPGEHRGVHAGA